MGFQRLYTEQQVVNIVEQIGSRDMNYWLQAVDSVFLGIAPEIEILKAEQNSQIQYYCSNVNSLSHFVILFATHQNTAIIC